MIGSCERASHFVFCGHGHYINVVYDGQILFEKYRLNKINVATKYIFFNATYSIKLCLITFTGLVKKRCRDKICKIDR